MNDNAVILIGVLGVVFLIFVNRIKSLSLSGAVLFLVGAWRREPRRRGERGNVMKLEQETHRKIESIADGLATAIEKFSSAELLKIVSMCDELSQTNCGWVAYAIRGIVKELAQNELQLRKDMTQARATKAKAGKR